MREVTDDAVDPAPHKRIPGIVASACRVSLFLPGQNFFVYADNFINAWREVERLTAPGLIFCQHLRSIRN
jgi:hypothetical protein